MDDLSDHLEKLEKKAKQPYTPETNDVQNEREQAEAVSLKNIMLPRNEVQFFKENNVTLIDRYILTAGNMI